jgi:ATP-dependent RNA helicase RhlE
MKETTQNMENPSLSFYGLGIAPKILEILANLKFQIPTPIQHKAIPLAIEGKDIIGIAQTGTGKTMAFAIPMIQHLAQTKSRGLIIVPTRELAVQVQESMSKIVQGFGIRSVVLIGGESMHTQIQALKRSPRIIIATPGRLLDFLRQKQLHLKDIDVLVLDEADRMLDMGFAPDIEQIIKMVPAQRQTLFFSATMPPEIMKMASRYMKLPVNVEIAPHGTSAEHVTHEVFIVHKDMKRTLLGKLLKQFRGSILLFCRTKMGARKIARQLRDWGHNSAEIHSDRSLAQRRQALEGFKTGRFRILVATDIASRGIDVKGIELVINYDLPDQAENYVHRIGRTGRAGLAGHAISIVTPEQRNDIGNIERLIKIVLPISQHPEIPQMEFEKPQRVFSAQSFRSRGGRRPFGRRRR